jgi:hypothetical protein
VPAGGGLHHSQQQQSQQQQQQQHEGKAVQMKQYKWWRDGEEPSYFICTPSVRQTCRWLSLHHV